MKKKQQKRLPDKLSDLLELAVEDCKKIQKLKGYKLNMYVFHTQNHGKCQVCMAGAVMACDLGAMRDEDNMPIDFGSVNSEKLHAIDAMRIGDFWAASNSLGIVMPQDLAGKLSYKIDKDRYGKERKCDFAGRASWKTYMECVAELRKEGF